MDPRRAALYRKHLRSVQVYAERRCSVCGRWSANRICGSSSFENLAAGGSFCTGAPMGRVRYRAGLELPGMVLSPKDFPEYAEQVRAALAQARRERKSLRVAIVRS